jgi:hypothetical protein
MKVREEKKKRVWWRVKRSDTSRIEQMNKAEEVKRRRKNQRIGWLVGYASKPQVLYRKLYLDTENRGGVSF